VSETINTAMILAAGRGERMRPLTDACPKPLLEAGGKPLIVYALERLAAAGVRQVIINTGRLGELFPQRLGDGQRFGLELRFSHEGDPPLETLGALARARPWLGQRPFWLVNGDVFCDFPFPARMLAPGCAAHLLLVSNPEHHPDGDFALEADGRLSLALSLATPRLTYSGIALLDPRRFDGLDADQPARLGPLLRQWAAGGELSGEHYPGHWVDVGTPERLAALDQTLTRPSGCVEVVCGA